MKKLKVGDMILVNPDDCKKWKSRVGEVIRECDCGCNGGEVADNYVFRYRETVILKVYNG